MPVHDAPENAAAAPAPAQPAAAPARAAALSGQLDTARVLALQRTAGNAAVGRMLARQPAVAPREGDLIDPFQRTEAEKAELAAAVAKGEGRPARTGAGAAGVRRRAGLPGRPARPAARAARDPARGQGLLGARAQAPARDVGLGDPARPAVGPQGAARGQPAAHGDPRGPLGPHARADHGLPLAEDRRGAARGRQLPLQPRAGGRHPQGDRRGRHAGRDRRADYQEVHYKAGVLKRYTGTSNYELVRIGRPVAA